MFISYYIDGFIILLVFNIVGICSNDYFLKLKLFWRGICYLGIFLFVIGLFDNIFI